MTAYTVKIQKSIAFLCTISKELGAAVYNIIINYLGINFTTVKYLGMNLTKYVQELYS